MKNNLSAKTWITIAILAILSAVAIRFNTKPEIYTGFIFALVGILFIGFYAEDKILGGLLGLVVAGAGLALRNFFPQGSTLTGEKLEAFMVQFNNYQDFIGKYFWAMLLLAGLMGLLGGAIGNVIKEDRTDKFSTYRITYIAIFVALAVAVNTARIGDISFGGFPIIISGYFLGPINGFIVGALADVVGFIIRPSATGGFNPLFVLTSALTGLIPVLVTNLLGEKYPKYSLVKVLIGIFIGQMLTSVVLVPIFRVMLYGGNTIWYFATQAFLKQILSIPVYAFLVKTVNDKISKTVSFQKVR